MAYMLVSATDWQVTAPYVETAIKRSPGQLDRKTTTGTGALFQAEPHLPRSRYRAISGDTPTRATYTEGIESQIPSATGEGYGYLPRQSQTAEIFDVSETLVEKANADRLALLRRKFDAKYKFTDPEAARLQILNERICRLIPSITREENDELEALADFLLEAGNELEMLRGEFGHE